MFATDLTSSDVLTCVCAVCRRPVDPNEGLLSVALSTDHVVPRRPDPADFWDDAFEPAYWRVAHLECHPDTEAVSYGIELHRACTPRQLLLWTAHLSEKPWLANTTWMSLVRSVAENARLDTGLWLPSSGEQASE